MRFVARCIGNALGVGLASLAVPGFSYSGSFLILLGTGILLALVQLIIRPVLKLVSLPLIIVTLGLFLVVINMIVLKVVDFLVDSLTISGIGSLFWGTIIVSIIGSVAMAFVRPKKEA